jgi:hypothetical protein
VEELLILLVQVLGELAVNILINLPFHWPWRKRATPNQDSGFPVGLFWLALGCLLGWISTLLFQHTLLPLPALRVLNVVVAPIAAAYLAQTLARRAAQNKPDINPQTDFWQAFWFTLGFVLVRLACASRA